jgi:DNA modification methylase
MNQTSPYNIELLAPTALRPYPRNARTHSKKQIKQIALSIEQFGFTNPVLISDTNEIIAGHGRVEAAKLLGLPEVPTVRLSHLSTDQRRAYILADNKLALNAGWDREMLAIELQALVDIDFSIALTGFEMAEIDIVLEEMHEAKTGLRSEDQLPDVQSHRVVSLADDLWQLGSHQLLCGNALERASYASLLGSERAEMVFTDPPYNVPIQGHVCGSGRVRHREFAMASGEMTEAEYAKFVGAALGLMAEASQDGSLHFVCMDWRHLFEAFTAGRNVHGELKNLVVWNKDNGGMGSFYRSKHELILIWKHGKAPHINNVELGRHGRNRTNVWDYPGANTLRNCRLAELGLHPTVKPAAMVADALMDASNRNGIVLDPFGGSGTILIAAERTGRRARMIEIDPIYVDVAIRRWQIYTGKNAVLHSTSETFEEVQEKRLGSTASAETTVRSEVR